MYKDQDRSSVIRNKICLAINYITLVDLAINVIAAWGFKWWYYTYICGIMRPFYFILQSRQMSNFALRYVLVMYDSGVMVIFIIMFIILFSWMG